MTNKDFEVKNNNTYSMASLVRPEATTSIAQLMQLQTLCYYYDIAIVCSESRQATCDLLTELNNLALQKALPRRRNAKGRAYLNKNGVMIFSDNHFKPYAYQMLIDDQSNHKLSLEQIKYVNNMLLKNYKNKGLEPAERAATLIPQSITLESIKANMLKIVKQYRVTFDLNRGLQDLYIAQNKCFRAIEAGKITTRKEEGEVYIDENQIIRFRAFITPTETNQLEGVTHSAPSFYIYSLTDKDKTSRFVFYGNADSTNVFECPVRTTVKTYTAKVIEKLTQGYQDFIVYVDKKAVSFTEDLNEFSGKTDVLVNSLAQTHKFEIRLLDSTNDDYLAMINTINSDGIANEQ